MTCATGELRESFELVAISNLDITHKVLKVIATVALTIDVVIQQ